MTIRGYSICLALGFVLSLFVLVCLLLFVNPEHTTLLGWVLFFVSVLLSLWGVLALLGLWVRIWLLWDEMLYHHVVVSFRQSFLLSVCMTTALVLQSLRVLSWVSICILLFGFVFMESIFYFFSRKKEG